MWILFGLIGLVLYAIIFFLFGIACLRNRHLILFLLGFILPILWTVGGVWAGSDEEPATT